MTLTIGSKPFHVSLGLVAGAALALYLFFHFGGSAVPLEQWLGSAKQEIRTTRVVLERARTEAAAAAHARAAAARLGATVAALTAQLESLRRVPPTPAVVAQEAAVCYNALTLCTARGDSLAHADSLDAARADSLARALHGADTTLARGVAVSECHLIHAGPVKLFGCPSRVRAFEWGAVLGASVTYLLRHH